MAGRKVFVLGLDGVPFSLLGKYLDMGLLPNLERILGSGYGLRQMDASVPDVSSTSWASFITGVNPGEHGIFGFMELKEKTYSLSFPSSMDVRAPAIWEIIGKTAGEKSSTLFDEYGAAFGSPLKSVVLNVPQTFPAYPMNGILTAGFVCPDMKRGTYPDSAYEYLASIGYMPDIDASMAASDPDAFFREASTALRLRLEAFGHFMDAGGWDLFIGVITETDRLHHFFYDAALDEAHVRHEDFLAFYREADEAIGALYDRFMGLTGGEGFFMTMSDHGFTTISQEVYMNHWLVENGFLSLNPSREYYDQIDTGTRAFAMDPARIHINAEGRYPRGSVADPDKGALVNELKEKLLELRAPDGGRVIKSVKTGDELYSGRAAVKAPDLVCTANDGYDLKGNLKKKEVFGTSHFRGMHTRHDAHCVMPEGVDTLDRLHIENLAGIILDTLSGKKGG